MAAIKRRDKLVYFRISGEEFDQIIGACEARGARSVSDLARSAVQAFIGNPESHFEQEMSGSLKRLQALVDELEKSVHQLVSGIAVSEAGVVLEGASADGSGAHQPAEAALRNHQHAKGNDSNQALGDMHD